MIFINENEEFESPIEFVPHDNAILINGEYFREIEDKHVPGIRPKSFYISINGEIYNAVTHRISRGAFGKGHRYCAIELVKIDGSRISIMLHRLLMIVFNFNEDFKNLEVNHISGNKRDNSLYNLEWTDHAGNMQHAYDHNLIKSGEEHRFANTSEETVRCICEELQNANRTKNLYKDLAEKYGVSTAVILQIDHGFSWTRVSKDYDLNHDLRVYSKRFSEEEVNFMCQYFQDHKDQSIDTMVDYLCNYLQIQNSHNNKTKIKRIYYKFPGYFSYITKNYDY